MDHPIHLVLVSGVAGSRAGEDGDPKKFLTERFPNCLIDEFSLLGGSVTRGRLLYHRSSLLLEQLRNSRSSQNVSHVFFGAPHRATGQNTWEQMCLRLILMFVPPPEYPVKVVQCLAGGLDGLDASFRTLSSSFDIVNFYESSRHPSIDSKCSILGLQDETDVPCDTTHEELWRFYPGEPVAEELYKRILTTRNSKNLLLYDFFRHLSLLDSQIHRLRPTFVASTQVDWICDNNAVMSWRSDPSVGILRISGPSSSGPTAVAARILGMLLEKTDLKSTVYLSFSFDKNNIRARAAFGLYLSLCRQLLSSRPGYFQRISPVSKFLTKDGVCTTETLWVMVRCLMSHLLEDQSVSVYCIVDGVDQCSTFQKQTINRLEGFIGPSKGRFKLLFSGSLVALQSTCESTKYQDVALESSSENMLFAKEQHVRDRINELALDNSAWDGLEKLATEMLGELPKDSPYLLVKLNMVLLEWTSRHSTRKSLKKALKQQPTTLDRFYHRALSSIDEANCNWVTAALRWVAFAVRPLRPTELAVAVALDEIPGGYPWTTDFSSDDFSDLIRRDIIGDLKQHMVPLLKVEDDRVYFIHDTFRAYLVETGFASSLPQTESDTLSQKEEEEEEDEEEEPRRDSLGQDGCPLGDSHCSLLFYCLEYVRGFGKRGAESFICEDGILTSFPADWDLGLLSYASLQWPRHFRQTTTKSEAQSYLLQFLQDGEGVKTWQNLHHLLNPLHKRINTSLNSPLKIVCNFGLAELVDGCIGLLAPTEDPKVQMRESLNLAARNGHDNVVRNLLDKGVRSPEALGLAARGGFENVVETLLSVDFDLNYIDETRYAPLHHATCGGHRQIVSLLLERGADINVLTSPIPSQELSKLIREQNRLTRQSSYPESDPDSDLDVDDVKLSPTGTESKVLAHLAWSESSLHLAALTGQPGIAELLLERGADVHIENSTGYGPLSYAAIGGFPELLYLLLRYRSDGLEKVSVEKVSTSDGNTALHLAVACGHTKAAGILLRHSKDAPELAQTANMHHLTPIHIAAREGHVSLLNLLVDKTDKKQDTESIDSTDKDDQKVSAIGFVIPPGNPSTSSRRYTRRRPRRKSTSRLSLDWRSRPSSVAPTPIIVREDQPKSALELAAGNGHDQVVRVLLERKTWSRPRDRAVALNLAAMNGHGKVVKTLVETLTGNMLAPAAVNADGKTTLHLAAEGGHSKILEELLAHPRSFPVNATTNQGIVPLHIAARAGHVNAMMVLVRHKAEKDLVDQHSKTALLLAAENGHLSCVEQLLEQGANHKKIDDAGRTALHLAAMNGHMAVAKTLCAFKDIMWTQDECHHTAFDLLVRHEKIKYVEDFIQMLDNTVGDETESNRGGIPLHMAANMGNIDMLRLLLDKGWRPDVCDAESLAPLHIAVMDAFFPGVKLLLEHPLCDIAAKDSLGRTVTHLATTAELASYLLSSGAANDVKDSFGRTPLYQAAFGGHLGVAEVLLDSKPKPNIATRDWDGWNVLHAAFDNPSMTKLLLKHNAEPNALTNEGLTPLALAIGENFIKTAELLLGAGADPNLAGAFEDLPLILAFEQENTLELIKILASKSNRLNLFAKGPDGDTALGIAARQGKLPEAQYLLKALEDGAAPGIKAVCFSALRDCVSSSEFNSELAEMFVKRDIDMVNRTSESQPTALHVACSKGTIGAVKWLLEKGAYVNTLRGGYSALYAAVESDQDAQEKVELLLEHGADVNVTHENQATALQRASSQGRTQLIKLLIDNGADVNLTGGDLHSVLNAAIPAGSDFATIRLIIKKADVSRAGRDGMLPIHIAAISDRADVLQVLVNAGANPLARDADGRSALIHGVANLSDEAVEYLLREGYFDADEVDTNSQTPLIIATMFGRKTTVKLLLQEEKGFSKPEVLNAQDYEGKTALARAAAQDHLEITEELLERGADPCLVDCRGRSALYWAARGARMETLGVVIRALEERHDQPADLWNVAVHGAIASDRPYALEKLLEREDVNVEFTGPDGWTPLYTAQRYDSGRIESILHQHTRISSKPAEGLQRPTKWHPQDSYRGLEMGPDGNTLCVLGGTKFMYRTGLDSGIVRADYPMLPLYKGRVYYFEVRLTKVAEQGFVGIGFCEDKTPLDRALGWDQGSRAFHSDDGCLFDGGNHSRREIKYADACSEAGKVLGCGINFATGEAFHTIDGTAVGRAFTQIRGKLYPAVSMKVAYQGWEVSVVFPGEDGKSDDFIYKGDLESEDLTREVSIESDSGFVEDRGS
ncbi:Ankyrin repeat-containing domain protein [Metarhizium guizhouense ARSEF 977]|uniref:Ankyrin repeat-containing domain protein n=1 Tax=Metarhizium guizhouense (strain ARSEF 977) TaxID=1276136 RepID=A0A0B4GPD4_METGA|nr:Ankyrin repeat-containing domain protein [Metarhizium guizhouense ARSEF 977]